jgi:hypothetical protein
VSARHTPGPWHTDLNRGQWSVRTHNGMVVTRIARWTEDIDEADARLIAAAPELLAALKTLVIDANRLCDRNLGGTYEADCRRAIADARTAIAIAEEQMS